MRRAAVLAATLIAALVLSTPALALEDGLMETTSSTPNEDATRAGFERVITNLTESPIDVAPRDLTTPGYPILTVTAITGGTFDNGIWTVGTLDAGRTASITYTGGTATTTTPEELPRTGQRDDLATLAFAGVALIGLGASMLRATRD